MACKRAGLWSDAAAINASDQHGSRGSALLWKTRQFNEKHLKNSYADLCWNAAFIELPENKILLDIPLFCFSLGILWAFRRQRPTILCASAALCPASQLMGFYLPWVLASHLCHSLPWDPRFLFLPENKTIWTNAITGRMEQIYSGYNCLALCFLLHGWVSKALLLAWNTSHCLGAKQEVLR